MMFSTLGAVLTFTARTGNLRDARFIHAFYRHHRTDIQRLYNQRWGRDITPECQAEGMQKLLPDGWVWLGSGAYRAAFMSPKGVVYKVNRALNDGYNGNSQEAQRVQAMVDYLPAQVRIPAHTLYAVGNTSRDNDVDTVMAMVPVDTSAPFTRCYGYDCAYWGCHSNEGNMRAGIRCSNEAMEIAGNVTDDAHNQNVFPDKDGYIWVLDMGS